jgi:hypothetical protein
VKDGAYFFITFAGILNVFCARRPEEDPLRHFAESDELFVGSCTPLKNSSERMCLESCTSSSINNHDVP